MKQMKYQGRQGDTLTIHSSCPSLRAETRARLFGALKYKEIQFTEEGRIPLAYGEVSGHAHAIYEEGVAQLLVSNDVQETVKHLNITGAAILQHEEHEAIGLKEGQNVTLIQNEYKLKKIQRVAD